MSQTSDKSSGRKEGLSGAFERMFAANPFLLVGIAFEVGMLLGRRTNLTGTAKTVRDRVSDFADRAVTLAPSSMTSLVPDLFPAKARPAPARKRASPRKRAEAKQANSGNQ